MRRAILVVLAAVVFGAIPGVKPVEAGPSGFYEVTGVEPDEMLKMRAGAGVGYRIIVGLPKGTELRVYSCELIGGTSWCKVSLKQARGLKGFVSKSYLQEM